jgi:hypothetical protein
MLPMNAIAMVPAIAAGHRPDDRHGSRASTTTMLSDPQVKPSAFRPPGQTERRRESESLESRNLRVLRRICRVLAQNLPGTARLSPIDFSADGPAARTRSKETASAAKIVGGASNKFFLKTLAFVSRDRLYRPTWECVRLAERSPQLS